MKKALSIIAAALFSLGAHAEAKWCGYKDFFHLSDTSHPGIVIVNGNNDGDVLLQVIGPRSFVLRDGYACTSGFAHVTVSYDQDRWCVLDIKDGPWMMHPTVSASCQGIRYLGTRYDGVGTFAYSIDLD